MSNLTIRTSSDVHEFFVGDDIAATIIPLPGGRFEVTNWLRSTAAEYDSKGAAWSAAYAVARYRRSLRSGGLH